MNKNIKEFLTNYFISVALFGLFVFFGISSSISFDEMKKFEHVFNKTQSLESLQLYIKSSNEYQSSVIILSAMLVIFVVVLMLEFIRNMLMENIENVNDKIYRN